MQFFFFFKDVNTTDDSFEVGNDADRTSCGGAKASQRINTAVYVCWHRNTSISYNDLRRAFEVWPKYIISRVDEHFQFTKANFYCVL